MHAGTFSETHLEDVSKRPLAGRQMTLKKRSWIVLREHMFCGFGCLGEAPLTESACVHWAGGSFRECAGEVGGGVCLGRFVVSVRCRGARGFSLRVWPGIREWLMSWLGFRQRGALGRPRGVWLRRAGGSVPEGEVFWEARPGALESLEPTAGAGNLTLGARGSGRERGSKREWRASVPSRGP